MTWYQLHFARSKHIWMTRPASGSFLSGDPAADNDIR